MWWVQRGSLPDWYPQGMLASNGYTDAVKQLEEQNVHISEWAWLQTVFDLVLNNNSTVNHLYSKINSRL